MLRFKERGRRRARSINERGDGSLWNALRLLLAVSVVGEASRTKRGESKRCLRRFRTRSANRTVSQARKLGQSERPLLPSTSLKHGASRKVSAEKIFFENFLKERNGGE
jgi:hypothetical protein